MKIIAGPCSVDFDNKHEIEQALSIKFNGKSVLYGVRIVGLKSRTALDPKNAFIGIDYDVFEENINEVVKGGSNIKIHPSIEIANEIQGKFKDAYMATEIVDTWMQCWNMSKYLNSDRAIIWNPAVNHLGFPIRIMAKQAQQKNWKIGIKNGKSLGTTIEKSQNSETPMEKSWTGLRSYANFIDNKDMIMIHRGVEGENSYGYRNIPLHEMCKRVKRATKCQMFLDPSHICGPKLRDSILDFTLDAMTIELDGGKLYDGILIEVGTSKSDTQQHITLEELEKMCRKM